MKIPKAILITGASSGIGEALALKFAAEGVFLALSGRDEARLEDVGDRCREGGARVETRTVDTTDRPAMRRWIEETDTMAPLDLVIANAGLSAGTAGDAESESQARRIFAVNLDGVLNTVHPSIDVMAARGRGQIALMSSVASFIALPGAPAYAASKAAVRLYGESLRGMLAPLGIRVSVICPGFVHSRMTATNPYPMPFIMPAERAARIISRGLSRDRPRIAFPWPTYALAWLVGTVLPPRLTEPVFRRLPAKPPSSRTD